MASRSTQQARTYDHLFDPLYATSGAKDFYRNVDAAKYSSVEKVPVVGTMFSDNPHYPAHQYRLKPNKDVPDFVSQEFRGPPGAASVPDNMAELVSGPNRFKYFVRPLVPFLHAVPPEIVLEGESTRAATRRGPVDPAAAAAADRERKQAEEDGVVISNGRRTIASQTVYRESEAQTDPYTPEYVLTVAEPSPEILALAHMKAGVHLPAGRAEVQEIERMRQRRAFEEALPPMTDEASFIVRRRLMEVQEVAQWAFRERQADEANEARIQALQAALEARDKEAEFLIEQRVEDIQRGRTDTKDSALASIQKKRIQALRKLGKTREVVESRIDKLTNTGSAAGLDRTRVSGTHRDIIKDYSDFGSSVYAPLARDGRALDRPLPKLETAVAGAADMLGSGMGVRTLESTIPRKLVSTAVQRPTSEALKTSDGRMERTIAAHLKRVDDSLKASKLGKSVDEDAMPAWRQKKERVVRPPTPTFDDEDESDGEEDAQRAVLLLQKLVRGRAVQNVMFEGKERRKELIEELRVEQQLAARAAEIRTAEAARHQAERRAKVHEEGVMGTVQGEVVSATLDFLSKELVRLSEHHKIATVVRAAEMARREREGEEGGRRQAEERIRAKQEVVYKQVMRVHAQSAESFVDALLGDTINAVATKDAERETHVRALVLGPIVDSLEAEAETGAVVKDLVASFLLPEVERRYVQLKVEVEERRFVEAARRAIETANSMK